MDEQLTGPLLYKNWKAALANQPSQVANEYPLFSDARFLVDNTIKRFGPYCLFCLNPVSYYRDTSLFGPKFILRIDNHLQSEFSSEIMDHTNEQHYAGGMEADELAALISLALGIRLKAGDTNRFIADNSDPRGLPIEFGRKPDPIYVAHYSTSQDYILPSAVQQQSLKELTLLSTFHRLSEREATILIRAARMYQEAVWLVESTPEISWILLASMIEPVANHWRRVIPPLESFKESQLGKILENKIRMYTQDDASADALVKETADALMYFTGSTAKFRNFIIEFLPPPPAVRPPEFAQHPWAEDEAGKKVMKRTLGTIYKYRSRALHDGFPFPAPMCSAPHKLGDGQAFEEISSGLATSMKGAVWVKKDTPMLLHTFEYIVRNAILKWWKQVTSSSESTRPTQE